MPDGRIEFSVELDAKDAERELQAVKKKILKLESELSIQQGRKSALELELDGFADAAVKAKRRLEDLTRERDRLRGLSIDDKDYANRARLPGLEADIKTQQANVMELEQACENAHKAIKKCDREIQKTNDDLAAQANYYGEIEKDITALPITVGETETATHGVSRAAEEASKRLEKFIDRIKGLARRVFVFSLITMSLRNMRSWLGKAVKSNNEAASAIARLKGALLTLAQPLLNVVIPVFIKFVNMLTQVVTAIASALSMLFGTTLEASAAAAEGLYDEQNALKGVGGAAKKAGKELASFDEINKLSGENSGRGDIAPNFSDIIGRKLGAIEAMIGGALLAVGALLTFSGVNIPLGIALMAAGAATLVAVVAQNWDAIKKALQGSLGGIVALVSGALLALGAVLLLSGVNIPVGLALMAAGAVGLAMDVAANWDAIKEKLQGPLGVIAGLLGGALLVVGAVLAFSGVNLPLGIALMAAGAVSLGMAMAANWDAIKEKLQGTLGRELALVTGELLVLGAVLAFSGVNLPLGIALLAAGAIGLAATVAANWDSITELLGGPVNAIVALISGALLVLGVILLFTGAGIPLGLGMILAGGVGLAATVAPHWDAILERLQGVWGDISQWWSAKVAKYFTADYWKGLGTQMLAGLFNGLSDFRNRAKEFGSNLVSSVKNALGIHSPSKEFEEIGVYSAEGMVRGFSGVDRMSVLLRAQLDTMRGDVRVFLHDAQDQLRLAWESGQLSFTNSLANLRGLFTETFLAVTETAAAQSRELAATYSLAFVRIETEAGELPAFFAVALVRITTDAQRQSFAFLAVYNGTLSQVQSGALSTMNSITSWMRSTLNNLSTLLNRWSSNVVAQLNSIIKSINAICAFTGGSAIPSAVHVPIPALAQGAVIPPNREFLAVLGDQKSGTNIEAPMETLVAAFNRALDSRGMGGGGKTTIILELDKRQFGKATFDALKLESQRVGVRLE